jgi:hypothetical protein
MNKRQFSIRLTDGQPAHLESKLEENGCATIPELVRKVLFARFPMPKSASHTKPHTPQEEKNEEREKSPHTPLKEKEARKEEGHGEPRACARTRVEDLASALVAAGSIPALSVDLRKPPTLAEAIAYARLRMPEIPHETISAWHQTMTEQGWIFRNGNTVRNWAAALSSWWRKRDVHERGKRIRLAREREVAAIEKRVELNEKANSEREKRLESGTSANSRYFNGRPKLSNHVNISEAEKNSILRQIGI